MNTPNKTIYDVLNKGSIKGYTDLPQSLKLSKILRPETADMTWVCNSVGAPYVSTIPIKGYQNQEQICPCWSLAALLKQIPISYKDEGEYCYALINTNPKADPYAWCSCYENDKGRMIFECYEENPVDACVDMIHKLKKENLL